MQVASHEKTIRYLRERIGELEEEVIQLREALKPTLVVSDRFHFTDLEAKVVTYILNDAPRPKTAHAIAEWVGCSDRWEDREVSYVGNLIFRVRRKLEAHGLTICIKRGRGYYVPESKVHWFLARGKAHGHEFRSTQTRMRS